MKKKQSLLYTVAEPPREGDFALVKNLLLSDAIEKIHTNEKAVHYFLEVFSTPPKHRENARHRAEILQDLHTHPILLDRLSACLSRLDAIPSQYANERALTRVNSGFGSDSRYATASKQIVLTAATLLDVFERLRELLDIIEKSEPASTGLCALSTRLRALIDSADFSELCALLERFIRLPEDYRIEVQFTLNELGRFFEYDILSIDTMELEKAQAKGWRRLFQDKEDLRKKQAVKEFSKAPGHEVVVSGTQLRNQVIGGVYERLCEMLHQILQGLFSEFCGMSPELRFYQVGLALLRFYEKLEIDHCFPDFSEENSTDIHALSDLVLLVERWQKDDVVANDVHFSDARPGILISGENNSGKTVYLRSIATALLLAQNGLPLPAKSASITHCGNIKTLFATGEKAASIGTGAGRFEEEVSALSDILDSVKEGDLLFLNEIFQTTAYSEGAKGLYHILNHLSKLKIRWVCVSHLSDLYELFSENDVVMLTTTSPTSQTPFRLVKREVSNN